MDQLSDEERALAWAAHWNPSFVGLAIVDRNLILRSANPQFREMLGITPAELIGKRLVDLTPQPSKTLLEENAKLVISGNIQHYLLQKELELPDGERVKALLLMRGVYDKEGEFLFFISRIMLDEEGIESPVPSQKSIKLLEFIKQYGYIFAAIGTTIGAAIMAALKFLGENHV